MQTLMKLIPLLALSCFTTCLADLNWNTGRECTPKLANETTPAFKVNLNTLLTTLEEQAPLNNGFFNTTSGENSDKLYGLVQCRGDLSSEDCASCLKDSVQLAFNTCTNSNYTTLWFRWCFLRYSDEDFFGQWRGTLSALIYRSPVTDDSSAVAKGRNLMSELAAGVTNEPLMFKTGSVDIANGAKRYGLAQCHRDLNKSSCSDCLTTQVQFFDQVIGNRSLLETFGNGCSMWYNNYQFYFNNSVPAAGPPPLASPPVNASPPPLASPPVNASPPPLASPPVNASPPPLASPPVNASPPPPSTPSAKSPSPPPPQPSASARQLQGSLCLIMMVFLFLIFQ